MITTEFTGRFGLDTETLRGMSMSREESGPVFLNYEESEAVIAAMDHRIHGASILIKMVDKNGTETSDVND